MFIGRAKNALKKTKVEFSAKNLIKTMKKIVEKKFKTNLRMTKF